MTTDASSSRSRSVALRCRDLVRRPFVQRWGFVPVLCLLPVVLYLVLQVDPIMMTDGDSPSYVGYTQNMRDLVSRYGLPYFAVRFGLLLPGWFAFQAFGALGGHFALRYALSIVAAGSLYLLGRRHGSRSAGWYGAVMCLASPVFLRALSTTYSDTTGVPFLIAGFACMLMPSPRRWAWGLLGGLFLGLAVNSHPFVSAVVVSGVGSILLLECLRRNFRVLWIGITAVLGIVIVTLAGVWFYRYEFGVTGVIQSSIEWSRANTASAAKAARAPTLAWTTFSLHLYIPVVVAVVVAALCLTLPAGDQPSRWRRIVASPLADGGCVLAGVGSFYLVNQFVMKQVGLEYYFYASYMFSAVAIALTMVMVVAPSRWPAVRHLGWVCVALAVGVPLARNLFFDRAQMWVVPTVPLMVVALVALEVARRRRGELAVAAPILLTVCVGLLGLCPPRNVPRSPMQTTRADAHYDSAMGFGSSAQYDIFRIASQLIEVTPKWANDPGSVIFWYRTDSFLANTVQGTYGWLGSTVQYGDPGMPNITEQQYNVLRERTPRSIMLLGDTEADLQTGLDALLAVGLVPIGDTHFRLSAGSVTLYVEHLTFVAADCDQQWRNIQFAWNVMPATCAVNPFDPSPNP